jgi:hypothetical protein
MSIAKRLERVEADMEWLRTEAWLDRIEWMLDLDEKVREILVHAPELREALAPCLIPRESDPPRVTAAPKPAATGNPEESDTAVAPKEPPTTTTPTDTGAGVRGPAVPGPPAEVKSEPAALPEVLEQQDSAPPTDLESVAPAPNDDSANGQAHLKHLPPPDMQIRPVIWRKRTAQDDYEDRLYEEQQRRQSYRW